MKTRREFLKSIGVVSAGVALVAAMPGKALSMLGGKKQVMLSTGEPGTDSFHEETWKPLKVSEYGGIPVVEAGDAQAGKATGLSKYKNRFLTKDEMRGLIRETMAKQANDLADKRKELQSPFAQIAGTDFTEDISGFSDGSKLMAYHALENEKGSRVGPLKEKFRRDLMLNGILTK